MKVLKILAMLLLVALTGCSSMKMLPDGTYLGITTVKDDVDRSVSHVGRWRKVGKNPDGSERFEEVKDKGDVAVGPTVIGQALIGASGGALSAYIQGEKAKDVAKITSTCGGKGCAGGPGVVVYSVSESNSVNEIGINSIVGTGGTCGAACAAAN